MAERVSKPPGADRARQVDWSRYADGDWWRLRMGRDFDQSPAQALRAVRSWGHRNGRRISGVVSSDKTITIRITPTP